MSEKIVEFKRSIDTVYELANKKCDEGDYVGALSSLLFESSQNTDYADIYAHIADIYTELGLYENAICFWFKYLLKSKKKYYCDGFNGLGANYYFTGDKNLAGYYFGEQIKNDNGEPSVYEEVLEEFRDELLNEKPNIHLVKDVTDEEIDKGVIEKAREYNKVGSYQEAINSLNTVSSKSPLYGEAISERAFSNFCIEKIDDAVKDVKEGIKAGYVTVNSLTFAIHLFVVTETEGVENLLDLLSNLKAETVEEKYKKLTALCEFCLFEQADLLADDILKEDKFDVNTTFIKAFLTYNNGDYEKAETLFQRAYILSFSPIALFYLRQSQQAVLGNVKYKNFKIAFDLPTDEIENINGIIKSILEGEKTSADFPVSRLKEVADWCFTCGSNSSKIAIAVIFAKTENKECINYLAEQLVNPSIIDEVKMRMVSLLCEYSSFKELKVVYGHIFRIIKVIRPEFIDQKELLFKKAYSYAFGRLSLFESKRLHLLELGAIELQKELNACNNLDKIKDVATLACAIYFYSGMNTFKEPSVVYRLFDVKKKDVVQIIKLTEEIKDDD
ncbi:MAG: hypothetical protein E7360_05555 [Clostridiales bacterium]|nr:hypothetical protein [Clostridiales bacterium]